MSGRRRRSESLWDRKEEEGTQTEISGKIPYSSFRGDGSPRRSNSEANDAGDISGQPSREPMQGNENIPMDNVNSSGRHGMKMDPAFDEWENQYSSRPSDNSYDLPYRTGERGVGGSGNMSKDRDRSRSPHRSRGRDRDRGSTRGLARSRSRSRSRSRGRGRSPFSDERRESYESGDSRGSSRPCKDFVAGNCRRGIQCRFLHQELVDSRGGDLTEKYSGGSRFRDDRNSVGKGSDGYRKDAGRKSGVDHTTSEDDYHRGNRNAYDDQDHRRQANQTTRAPCRFFMMGKCNRTNCKFSHDVPKSAGYEGRSHDNSRPWNERQPQDQVSASGFSDFPKPSHDFDDKNKPWNGSSWNDLESGGFDEMSRDNILDDKNRTWDPPGWNGSEKNSDILSQPRSVTNYMDMNQESQIIHDSSQSHSQHVMSETSGSQLTNATTAVIPEVPRIPCFQQHQKQGEGSVSMMIDSHNMVSGQTHQQVHPYGSDFVPSVHNMAFQYPSTLNGTEKSSDMLSLSSLNGPKLQSNGSVQGMFLHHDLQKQADIQNKQGGKPLETSKNDIPQVMPQLDATVASNEQVPQVSSLPVSLPQMSQKLNLANALEFLYSLPNTASSGAPVDSMVVQQNLDTKSKEQYESSRDMVVNESTNISGPMGILSNSMEKENQASMEQVSSIDPNPSKLVSVGMPDGKQEPVGNLEVNENRMADKNENTNPGKSEAQGKLEEGNISNDEKAMRQFKIALVEFVKEILKPTWKEGKMSREVYKTIVKKVVDKVTSTIQGNQIPRTQEKIDQYLTFSKSKITKLVEAYVGRFLKA